MAAAAMCVDLSVMQEGPNYGPGTNFLELWSPV